MRSLGNLFSFQSLPSPIKGLILVHVGVYLLEWMPFGPAVAAVLGLGPATFPQSLRLWQPLTYVFLHPIGPWDFIFFLLHMYILSVFGPHLARRWGGTGFLSYYFAVGLIGASVTVLLSRMAPPVVIGSMTALLGLLSAFAAIAPSEQLVLYFFPVAAIQLFWLAALLEVLMGISGMSPWGVVLGHLAGMAGGFLLVRRGIMDRDWGDLWRTWTARRRAARSPVRLVSVDQEVDRILEKISKKGINSLTAEEHDLMRRYSKSKR